MKFYNLSPAAMLLVFATVSILMSAITVVIALKQPHLDIPPNAIVLSVNGETLTEVDRYEEPDQIGNYEQIKAFNARQGMLHAQLSQPQVTVTYALPGAQPVTETLAPRARMLGDLPFAFWFQNFVALFSMLIGGWVLGLRPHDWGVRMFVGTTLLLPFAALSASIYSTRQIALPETLFYTLSSINAFGAMGFGIFLVGLFTQYPKQLFRPRWLLIPGAIFGTSILLTILQVGPDNMIGMTILTEMAVSLLFGVFQWYASRREPVNRAGLRWFILVSLTGCLLFVTLSAAPNTLGLTEQGLVSQGLAFGFFNIMHVGLALGVLRYRVFNLDRWSYYIWLWVSGMAMIFVLDLLLINLLRGQPWVSLGASLLIAGFLYFPLRQLLMNQLLHRREATLTGRMPDIAGAALAPSFTAQNARWDTLLRDVFKPLAPPQIIDEPVDEPRLQEDGLTLLVPGIDTLAPRRLRYALRGRRLFNQKDLEIIRNILQTYQLAWETRHAYERGTILERDRISRDIHDNIGAQLLSALHSSEIGRKDDLLRESLSDLRTIVNDGFLAEYPLGSVIADLRLETSDRLATRDLRLIWRDAVRDPADDTADEMMIPFEVVNGLRSILREAISNVLRHARATEVEVDLSWNPVEISLMVQDNGIGTDAAHPAGVVPLKGGNGIPNIIERATALAGKGQVGGRIDGATGTRITVSLPIDPDAARKRSAAE
ncbi:ATP-binding protein [Sulfitobacter sp. HNIBRBA3233]|uniref:sensor histidine kinase n=1 Tax=Sulfitobacter marinivivus TaxID=3158558 RepID=UPI0032DEBD8E